MWEVICADLARSERRTVPSGRFTRLRFLLQALPKVRSLAAVGFRVSHFLGRRSPTAGAAAKAITQVITGSDIAYDADIGPGLTLLHPNGIVIAAGTIIGARCTIHQGVTLGGSPAGTPILGDDVTLSPGCRVLGAVRIGEGIHVGANAVVVRSFEEPHVVIVGMPARVLRPR
jgi:serine O-acetyltransferase